MSHVLEYHTCEGPWTGPHPPEHRSIHPAIESAIAAVPRGRTGYVDWHNATEGREPHWCIAEDGSVRRYPDPSPSEMNAKGTEP